MENHFNCIYYYKNKINGKGYIGKAEDFNKRHSKHLSSSKNKNDKGYNYTIHRAIRKYSIENFNIIILKENIPLCLLGFYEEYYADKYNTYINIGYGYNMAKCGNGGNTMYGKTEEEKKIIYKKISNKLIQNESVKGKNNPMYGVHRYGKDAPSYGKKCSDETRKKISESHKGKKQTKESIEKMVKTRKENGIGKGIKNANLGCLINRYDLNENYIDTHYQFEYEEMGFNHSAIKRCCEFHKINYDKNEWFKKYKARPNKQHKGFIFKYHEECE